MKMSFSIYCLMVCFVISPIWCKGRRKPNHSNNGLGHGSNNGHGRVRESLAAILEKLEAIHDKLENCTAVPECPDGWVRFDKSCYFIQDTTVTATMDEAQWLCKDQNTESDLVAVESVAELNFLTNTLVALFPDSSEIAPTWITSGITVDGVRIWAKTGQAVSSDVFTDEDDGECIAFLDNETESLAATDCESSDRQFICELHL